MTWLVTATRVEVVLTWLYTRYVRLCRRGSYPLTVERLCWRGSKPATRVEVVLAWFQTRYPCRGCVGVAPTSYPCRGCVGVAPTRYQWWGCAGLCGSADYRATAAAWSLRLYTGSETSCLSDSPLIPTTVPALAGHETDGTDLFLTLLQNGDWLLRNKWLCR